MDYEKLKQARNEAHSFRNLLGIILTDIEKGRAVCELTVNEQLENQIHSVAGGCLYTLADAAAGSLCAAYGVKATTADVDFHYLSPGIDCRKIYAHAKEIKHGKRLMVIQVEVSDQDEKLLCFGTFTFAFLNEEIDYI